MENSVKVWKKAQYKTHASGKIRPKANYAKLVFGFAILMPVFIGIFVLVASFSGAGEGFLMSLGLILPLFTVVACLLLVRANMSEFVTFIEEDGILYRVMFANKGGAPVNLDKLIKRMQKNVANAQQASCIETVIKNPSSVVYPIINVIKLHCYAHSIVAVCTVQVKKKNKRKRFRIIKDYESMDTLIQKLNRLKISSENFTSVSTQSS